MLCTHTHTHTHICKRLSFYPLSSPGDYVILLSTGLSWYTALLFNFVSSLTAVVGFFIGVAVGTASSDANGWILAAAAGVFLYIALVDLVSY